MITFSERNGLEVSTAGMGRWLIVGAVIVLAAVAVFKLGFSVNNHEVVALTYPNGRVTFYTQPGIYGQWLGTLSVFQKNKKYETDEKIQFSDGAHASLKISVQYEVPEDVPHLANMYQRYPSAESVESGLIETNIRKAVVLTGRMMSSKESYAEKRGDLFNYLEDQTADGMYRTETHNVEVPDDLDKTKTKVIGVTSIVLQNGQPARIEKGLMDTYNIKTSNFVVTITYDPDVEKQIQSLQVQAQQINQKIAEAKMAEQNAITIGKNGEAQAAAAKWEQERSNATEQAQAEQKVRNAEMQKKEAEFKKAALILEGEGEAQKRQLIMNADGALAQKLQTYAQVQQMWSSAFQNYQGNIVPQIVSGGSGSTGNGGVNFMEMLGAKAAKDLSLDLGVTAGRHQKQ